MKNSVSCTTYILDIFNLCSGENDTCPFAEYIISTMTDTEYHCII